MREYLNMNNEFVFNSNQRQKPSTPSLTIFMCDKWSAVWRILGLNLI